MQHKKRIPVLVLFILLTGTAIYQEATQLSALPDGNHNIRPTVEEATLDDLDTRSMLLVWGCKSGNRIIVRVLMYSNTESIKRGIFEDSVACP